MIVYGREINLEDIKKIDNNDNIIYYKDSNIAYIIVKTVDNYVIRKKKIFNNQLMGEEQLKTPQQVLKKV